MGEANHDFRKYETGLFSRTELDSPDQSERKRKNRFFAQAVLADRRTMERRSPQKSRLVLLVGRIAHPDARRRAKSN
jgi:hypothetical protein